MKISGFRCINIGAYCGVPLRCCYERRVGEMVRRSLALLLPLVLLGSLGFSAGHAAGTPDEQYVPIMTAPIANQVGVQFLDNQFTNIAGYLSAAPSASAQPNLCTSYDDAICKSGDTMAYSAHLSGCLDAVAVDCVSGIFAIDANGARMEGKFVKGMPDQPSNLYQGNASLGILPPGVDSLWSLPGVANGGGTTNYLVVANVFGMVNKKSGELLAQPVPVINFNAGIYPVTIVQGAFKPSYVSKLSSGTLGYFAPAGVGVESCAGVSTTECARREAFPKDVTFGLTIRLSQPMKGWLHGRIQNPAIVYAPSASGATLTIQALPVSVPIVAGWTDRANLPAKIPGTYDGSLAPGQFMPAWAYGDAMLSLLQDWLPLIQNRAQANPSEWEVRNLSSSEMAKANSCITNTTTLAGFVSTNSTAYTAGPPEFNSETQSLDYKLASPHFMSNGDVFKGVYTLAIKSDVARCIYHFNTAPIKATISVTDESGQSSVAVESMSEHDGWIYLSASNFEFSSPTVHVKLAQDAPIVTTIVRPLSTTSPPAAPTPIVKPTGKKYAITCAKGKFIKKVTALSPQCPNGYKKR